MSSLSFETLASEAPAFNVLTKTSDFSIPIDEALTYFELPNSKPNIVEVHCKTLTGARISIKIDEEKTIFNLKQSIYKKTDIMIDDQQLVYNGKSLENESTIKSFNIDKDIHMVCRLRGGMFHSTSSRADWVSINFTTKFQKGTKMIHGLKKFGIYLDTLDELESRLQRCETDEQINKIYSMIEGVYMS